MEDLRTAQKNEALKRMKMLHIDNHVIKDFEKNGRVYYSERQNSFFDGILFWLDNKDGYVNFVKSFEKKHNALVYHAQLTYTIDGEQLSLLYVSKDKDEWDMDKDDLIHKSTLAYVAVNVSEDGACDPVVSEFGTIGIVAKNGGVSRTY